MIKKKKYKDSQFSFYMVQLYLQEQAGNQARLSRNNILYEKFQYYISLEQGMIERVNKEKGGGGGEEGKEE